ncbi:hypothetical protein EZ449_03105 [Pedobacter frigidisoli]|uniref:Uncharacterized protein n=1 Tax=Pedobacter frigidisoli TaxID=2530455 RepID=A0A4R0P812_9SPHI|nr:hypothetical protein [Pedobacter frigidisoli]TCD12029.1 hypothetical protein EZ449_03105 [Pedobacter frigidisoli]
MNFPLYIYYELLIRLSAIDSELGEYLSTSQNQNVCILRTTNGTILVPTAILIKQFESPDLITTNELVELASGFKANYL